MTDGKPVSREALPTTANPKLFNRRFQHIALGWKAYFVLAVFLLCALSAMTLGAFDVGVLSIFFGEASMRGGGVFQPPPLHQIYVVR